VADAFPVLFSRPGPSPIIGVTMFDPVMQLDQRFSDPDAQPTTWAAAREVLQAAQISWISTVRADGRPHVTPLVAVWLDGALHFTTGPAEQKAVNLRTNPNVVLTTGCNTWDRGLDVVVESARHAASPTGQPCNGSPRLGKRPPGEEMGRQLAVRCDR
jgi:hypothetical protein